MCGQAWVPVAAGIFVRSLQSTPQRLPTLPPHGFPPLTHYPYPCTCPFPLFLSSFSFRSFPPLFPSAPSFCCFFLLFPSARFSRSPSSLCRLCCPNDMLCLPSPPLEARYLCPEEEIARGPACWLWDYLKR